MNSKISFNLPKKPNNNFNFVSALTNILTNEIIDEDKEEINEFPNKKKKKNKKEEEKKKNGKKKNKKKETNNIDDDLIKIKLNNIKEKYKLNDEEEKKE